MTATSDGSSPKPSLKQLVFIAMPFGKKKDLRQGCEIDFDRIYEIGIKPAFETFDLDFIRADEERGGGMIHLQMFERLLLAQIAIVDVTSENANVFYELGVRHAARPQSTIILRGGDGGVPFDINMMRAIMYKLDNGVLSDEQGAALADAIAARLREALGDGAIEDSPIFTMIPSYMPPALDARAAKTFREREDYLNNVRMRLQAARREKNLPDVIAIEAELGEINDANTELVIDLVLSYRDLATLPAYDRLITLVDRMPKSLFDRAIPVRQQYALALNRRNAGTDRHRAIDVLDRLCQQQGETSETCGMLGRIFKDCYNEALQQGQRAAAIGHLQRAIDYYRRGFDADPRDYYPGVNLITLLTMEGSDESAQLRAKYLPAVTFAVAREDAINKTNYWTIATIMELAIHGNDWKTANNALARILSLHELAPFAVQSTAGQLALVRSYEPKDIDLQRLDALMVELLGELSAEAAAPLVPGMAPSVYGPYRETKLPEFLDELDGIVASMIVKLPPKSVGLLLNMISEPTMAMYRSKITPAEMVQLQARLPGSVFAKLQPG